MRCSLCVIALALVVSLGMIGEGAAAQAASQPVYVPAQHGDCINTFIVRLMVAASNSGASFGEFEGSRFMVVRKGTNPKKCWLEMGQWNQYNQLEDSKRLQCLFVNPLGL